MPSADHPPVFISHSTHDRDAAQRVVGALEGAGIRCWIAPRDIPGGANYAETIIQAISNCRLILLVFSSHANGSIHCIREMEQGVANKLAILPFRIESLHPSGAMTYFLAGHQWVDALPEITEDSLARLVKAAAELVGTTPASGAATAAGHLPAKTSRPGFKAGLALAAVAACLVLAAPLLRRAHGSRTAPPAPSGNDWVDLFNLHKLVQSGDTNAAARLASQLAAQPGAGDDPLRTRLFQEMEARQRQQDTESTTRAIHDLNRLLSERGARAEQAGAKPGPAAARPRVIALLPLQQMSPGAESAAIASFYTTALLSSLGSRPGFLVVDRNHLRDILQEQGLRLSELSDQRAGFEIGKLLPASLLLAGEILCRDGRVMLGVRLLDSSTSRYLATVETPAHRMEELGTVIPKLVGELAEKARLAQPLTATLVLAGGEARALIGEFQRAAPGMTFAILPATTGSDFLPGPTTPVGEAVLAEMGEQESLFTLRWKEGRPPADAGELLLRERPVQP